MSQQTNPGSGLQTATLAGGCFWCLEACYEQLDGVKKVVSGYMGGKVDNPSYEAVCDGDTGHAEVVQLTFDPNVVTFEELLVVFFTIHDPTTLNRQGNDVGTQYRSAIFFHDEDQHKCADHLIAELMAELTYSAPIVTEVVPAQTFWPAEAYHQHYYQQHPDQGYCSFVVAPKLKKFREKFTKRLKTGAM
ncbi:methionine sulfoxide reductase A [Pandoraea terrae]|uniref:Peptide methionine sulfoxide reductase MsrA n=1 Tax=Pandoraea terrae TaxID=1537710 RepID=A0A5E4UM23_9BURK|nr:peptide-methionine (S)-S-oxide reductase MsrA [Pandoraea terrae]VVE01017.1 methionine sulfoxide reductase A [Pandoraea terrae]